VGALTRSIDAVITEARRPIREGIEARGDLVAVVRERLDFWSALAQDESRRVDASLPTGGLVVAATPADLAATVDALLGNVFAHTPAGTAFAVTVEQRAEAAVLTVSDDGPGWRLASPETRGRSGAGSTGLGLDIARRTASASGGDLSLRDTIGGGAVVEVRLGLLDG
jgi:signal transduction histidine kinase